MAVAGFMLGLLGLILSFITPFVWMFGIAVSFLGLIFSCLGLFQARI